MSFHDRTWIWNSKWQDYGDEETAGGFIHFRKQFNVDTIPLEPIKISITADTRYKLYINSKFVHYGPVKGDAQQWFYDELDIQPFIGVGVNHIAVHVLRLYYNTRFGTSFPRLPLGGLRIQLLESESKFIHIPINTDETWETAIDVSAALPALKEDMFLNIYEAIDRRRNSKLTWMPATPHKIFAAFGLGTPWNLFPRSIPPARLQPAKFEMLHNIKSHLDPEQWEEALIGGSSITLPAGTSHRVEIEAAHHLTAFLQLRFLRPQTAGSELRITYSECYEDPPASGTGKRHLKGDRRDTSKSLLGSSDTYVFGGLEDANAITSTEYQEESQDIEIFAPYHLRTFRFLALEITVTPDSDLTFIGSTINRTNYPLDVLASFQAESKGNAGFPIQKLWDTSILTLENCMHDCYEDCPFYEQLQYAMDTRSSILFTYYTSGDDRLARQAIRQLANSYQPALGLTASRAPCHHLQIIPNFSLFWICTVVDHFEHYGDAAFTAEFLPICDAVLGTFRRRIDPENGLIRVYPTEDFWDFVDWTQKWTPFGIPPAGRRTGFQTFASSLYAYTLQKLASVQRLNGRIAVAGEYETHAKEIAKSIRAHCFDGEYFTDGLAALADANADYSIHNQVWAILGGAITGAEATALLSKAMEDKDLTNASVAMSFYTLRALSLVGGGLYERYFFQFWKPWLDQLAQNLTTWVEDPVSQRSDCHAWGSAPLYEFLAEIVGIKPLEPGWRSLSFQPRISLFENLSAKVPVMIKEIGELVIADVSWSTGSNGKVTLALDLKTQSGKGVDVPIHVSLLEGQKEIVASPLVLKNVLIQSSVV